MRTNTRYFYRTETRGNVERRFAVAYQYNRETGETAYGASVYRHELDGPNESFVKRDHRDTADARLRLRPVRLIIDTDDTSGWEDVENQIRAAIRVHGTRGPRNVLPLTRELS